MGHIVFQSSPVSLTVFYSGDRSLRSDQRRFDGNAFAADNYQIVLGIHCHLIQDNGPDFTAHILDGASLQQLITQADLCTITGIGINDQHTGGGIDTPVDHILYLFVQDLTAGVGAFVIPDLTLAQTCVPKAIKDIVNAADYGVPQLRKRFVLHAVRRDIYQKMRERGLELTLPIATHSKDGKDGKQKWVTVREAFEGLPRINAGDRYQDEKIKNHYCAGLSEKNLRRMQIIRAKGGSRSALPPDLILNCHKTYSGHSDVYGIMDPDKPSPTMTGGCLSYSKGRFGHPFENRAISVREAARLQTFPDDYVFGESLTKAALEIGNAVPIKLVKASGKVFYDIINVLNKEEIMKQVCQFLKDAGTYYLATMDGDQPRVRPFGTAHIFEDKLYIQTGKGKAVAKQINANPKVEICAMKGDEWIRIDGTLVLDDRVEAQESMLDDYPSLRKMYTTGSDGNTAVYYFKDATATIYSFSHAPVAIKF